MFLLKTAHDYFNSPLLSLFLSHTHTHTLTHTLFLSPSALITTPHNTRISSHLFLSLFLSHVYPTNTQKPGISYEMNFQSRSPAVLSQICLKHRNTPLWRHTKSGKGGLLILWHKYIRHRSRSMIKGGLMITPHSDKWLKCHLWHLWRISFWQK